jgi:oligopeptide transport system ATP-binding protein
MMGDKKLVEVKHLKKYFSVGKNLKLKAIDDVSFSINEGETLGLVGESGCGKTTTGRSILGLYEPTAGEVSFDGIDVYKMGRKQEEGFRRSAQMIFQDPYASLNPRMTVGDIIAEGIDIHKLCTGEERTKKIYELLNLVGLNKDHINRFPHEFSGGQRQRIGIARALAIQPKFIVCDEPISALDVSIQAQIVNLLMDLQQKLNLTYLFIAHDLSMVKHISNRVAVMYLGAIFEIAESMELYDHPMHPYTKALLSAIPVADPKIEKSRERVLLKGDVPSPIHSNPGCKFAGRCQFASSICREKPPEMREISKGHYAACHALD